MKKSLTSVVIREMQIKTTHTQTSYNLKVRKYQLLKRMWNNKGLLDFVKVIECNQKKK